MLEDNRDWYQSMIPLSPPGNGQEGVESQQSQCEESNSGSNRKDLAAAAERIKFQITLEEPEDEDFDVETEEIGDDNQMEQS